MFNNPDRSCGFTFLELVVSLAVVSIGVVSAAPSFQQTIIQNRLSASSNDIMTSLLLARSEAVKRNTRVTMRNISGDWSNGWTIFEDSNNNAVMDISETVISQSGKLAPEMQLAGNTPVEDYISYTELGQAEKTSGSIQMGTLTLCIHKKRAEKYYGRAIILSSGGRTRVSKLEKDLNNCA